MALKILSAAVGIAAIAAIRTRMEPKLVNVDYISCSKPKHTDFLVIDNLSYWVDYPDMREACYHKSIWSFRPIKLETNK